jgi:hypothetical protein
MRLQFRRLCWSDSSVNVWNCKKFGLSLQYTITKVWDIWYCNNKHACNLIKETVENINFIINSFHISNCLIHSVLHSHKSCLLTLMTTYDHSYEASTYLARHTVQATRQQDLCPETSQKISGWLIINKYPFNMLSMQFILQCILSQVFQGYKFIECLLLTMYHLEGFSVACVVWCFVRL